MRHRMLLAFSLLAACKPGGTHALTVDGGDQADVPILPPLDGRDPRLPDAGPDARPDADPDAPDTTPPGFVDITPTSGNAIWLHSPIRLTFDEPLAAISGTTATASIGSTSIAATVALEGTSTIAVRLDASARGVGTLALHVDAHVADAAGNRATIPIDASFSVAAWQSAAIDRGYATGVPSIAVDAQDRVLSAWAVGYAGSRRASVALLDGPVWRALGVTLGSGDVSAFAVAFDAAGAPLVAYVDSGVAHVARWASNTWTELAAPGDATYVELATPPSGAPILALVDGGHVTLDELAGDGWTALGSPLALSAACTGEPTLATPAAHVAVIGWIDSGQTLRVYRYNAGWTAMQSLTVDAGSRMSVAARGSDVAIAWDRWAGSWGVLAAQAASGATSWTQLGKPLDIDIAGDARAPAVAYPTSGGPVVAWTELVETAERGAIAQWSGSAWRIVGGVTWIASPGARPAGTRLALDAGGAPIAGTTSGGDVVLARFNGPRTAALGMTARGSLSGCSFDVANPPALLSNTGCFDLTTPKQPVAHAGLVPYDVVAELWTDGAKKRRWIGLPAGVSATLGANGSWIVPAGTLMVKEFALETTPGDPSTRRPIETRFYVVDASQNISGFTYQWNVAGTDASLLTDGEWTVDWQMDDGSTHRHLYPSRSECYSCHTAYRGPVLGMRPEQLARWYDYGGVIADQLATLVALGVGPSSTPPAFTAPDDPSASWELRMRGYMHANCSHCHNPDYISIKDLRYGTPLGQTGLCSVITPGDPASSVVYQKVTSRPGMPPLGTLAVDPLAKQMLGNWITGMTSCP